MSSERRKVKEPHVKIELKPGDQIGKHLSAIRDNNGISPSQLARAMDKDQSHVWHIEKGKKLPGTKTILEYLRAVNKLSNKKFTLQIIEVEKG